MAFAATPFVTVRHRCWTAPPPSCRHFPNLVNGSCLHEAVVAVGPTSSHKQLLHDNFPVRRIRQMVSMRTDQRPIRSKMPSFLLNLRSLLVRNSSKIAAAVPIIAKARILSMLRHLWDFHNCKQLDGQGYHNTVLTPACNSCGSWVERLPMEGPVSCHWKGQSAERAVKCVSGNGERSRQKLSDKVPTSQERLPGFCKTHCTAWNFLDSMLWGCCGARGPKQ